MISTQRENLSINLRVRGLAGMMIGVLLATSLCLQAKDRCAEAGVSARLHDCNGDGILSIVGDVPCFVQCVYFNNCPE